MLTVCPSSWLMLTLSVSQSSSTWAPSFITVVGPPETLMPVLLVRQRLVVPCSDPSSPIVAWSFTSRSVCSRLCPVPFCCMGPDVGRLSGRICSSSRYFICTVCDQSCAGVITSPINSCLRCEVIRRQPVRKLNIDAWNGLAM